MPTQDLLNELFYYNPDTWGFVRRVPPRYTKKCPPENDRYKQLVIAGKRYRVPRIVWLYLYKHIPKGRVIEMRGAGECRASEGER